MSPRIQNDDEPDFSDDDDDENDDGLRDDLEALRQACLRSGTNFDHNINNNDTPSSFAVVNGGRESLGGGGDSDSEDDVELVRKLQNRFSISDEAVSMKPLCVLPPILDDDDDEDDYETLCAVRRRFAAYYNSENFMKEPEHVPAPGSIGTEMETYNDFLVDRTGAFEDANILCDNMETQHSGFIEQHQSEACKLLTLKYSSFPKSAQKLIDAIKKNRSCQKFIRSKLTQIEARIEENNKLKKRVQILKDFRIRCNRIMGRALCQGKDLRIQLVSARNSEVANNRKGPAMQKGPVENSHVANYKRALEMFPLLLESKTWKDVEMENLQKGIEQQYQEMVLQSSMDQFSGSEGSPGNSNCLDIIISSVRDLEITPEKLREFLPKVNWDKLASLYVAGRSGPECRALWYNFGDPLINNTDWSKKEDMKLWYIIQENGVYNWPDIAASLGTNRTPFQCLERYQRSLNFSMLNKEWTKEEDAQLLAAVETYGKSNWQAVAFTLKRRTGTQCSNRWKKSIDPNRPRKGRFTVDEDKRLRIAVKIFGPKDWNKIAEFVPGRTGVRCCERWTNSLDPSVNFGPWTEEEDSKLEAAFEEYGYCWAKIAKCIPRRTDNACRRRWMKLHKNQVPLIQAARKITKAALIGNFVDRESERPTLGPDDFLPLRIRESIHGFEKQHKSKKRKRKLRGEPNMEKEDDAALGNIKKKIRSQKQSEVVQLTCEEGQTISNGAKDVNICGNQVVLTKRRLNPCSEKYYNTASALDNSLRSPILNPSMTTGGRELNTTNKKGSPESNANSKQFLSMEIDDDATLASFLQAYAKWRRLEVAKNAEQACSPTMDKGSELVLKGPHPLDNRISDVLHCVLPVCTKQIHLPVPLY